ncbi:MAG: hypothetical protein GX573_05115 [Chloroflexi bacterium]|nr:hypothetical protein [Chloroflexota bacterium]
MVALPVLLSALPADFQAPVIVVQHLAPRSISLLSEILRRRISLGVQQIAGGERLVPGYV